MHFITRRAFVHHAALLTAGARTLPDLANALQPVTPALGQRRQLDPALVRRFSSSLQGRVVSPRDNDYASARLVFNRAFDRHPALIVRCASPDIGRASGYSVDVEESAPSNSASSIAVTRWVLPASRGVSINSGMVMPRRRSSLQTAKPSGFGIITSSTMASYSFTAACTIAESLSATKSIE